MLFFCLQFNKTTSSQKMTKQKSFFRLFHSLNYIPIWFFYVWAIVQSNTIYFFMLKDKLKLKYSSYRFQFAFISKAKRSLRSIIGNLKIVSRGYFSFCLVWEATGTVLVLEICKEIGKGGISKNLRNFSLRTFQTCFHSAMASFMQAMKSWRERGAFCTPEIYCKHLYSRIQILLMTFFLFYFI